MGKACKYDARRNDYIKIRGRKCVGEWSLGRPRRR
jgi:hypothetical protein